MVAVVTLLLAALYNTVTASRYRAAIGAGICRVIVAIITSLTGVHSPVPTNLTAALGVATIPGFSVAIVAPFAFVDSSVTAALGAAL